MLRAELQEARAAQGAAPGSAGLQRRLGRYRRVSTSLKMQNTRLRSSKMPTE